MALPTKPVFSNFPGGDQGPGTYPLGSPAPPPPTLVMTMVNDNDGDDDDGDDDDGDDEDRDMFLIASFENTYFVIFAAQDSRDVFAVFVFSKKC